MRISSLSQGLLMTSGRFRPLLFTQIINLLLIPESSKCLFLACTVVSEASICLATSTNGVDKSFQDIDNFQTDSSKMPLPVD